MQNNLYAADCLFQTIRFYHIINYYASGCALQGALTIKGARKGAKEQARQAFANTHGDKGSGLVILDNKGKIPEDVDIQHIFYIDNDDFPTTGLVKNSLYVNYTG